MTISAAEAYNEAMNIKAYVIGSAASLVVAVSCVSVVNAADKAEAKADKQTSKTEEKAAEKPNQPSRVKPSVPEGSGRWVNTNRDGKTCPQGSDGPYEVDGKKKCWVKNQ